MTLALILRCALVVFALASLSTGAAAQASSSARERRLRHQHEDEVARLFETIRARDGLPALTRIGRRESLEELVCSAASDDAPVWRENRPGALMYRTDDPAKPTPVLERIAGYIDPLQTKDQPNITRYAVAVWPTSSRESGQPVYWVGVQVYNSAWWEFIDNNLTDNRSNKDQWRKLVTPTCHGVE